jgi:hypothetical protein
MPEYKGGEMKMKQFITLATLVGLVLLFNGCPDPNTEDESKDEFKDESPKTCVQFVNNNDFAVTIYRTDAKVGEIAALEPGTTSIAIETEEAQQGVTYYPTYYIFINDIPLSYDGMAITARIDKDKTNRVIVPLLSAYPADERAEAITSNVYIKIQNSSGYSMSLVHNNIEETPAGSSSTIVMSDESAHYIAIASDVSSYQFMKNTNIPIAFPIGISTFISGHLYSFTYNGTNLTLLADRALSIDSALADVLSFPADITAQAQSASSIYISWSVVSEASGYNVYRSSSEEGTYTKLNETIITGTDYTDTDLTNGTSYYYKVASVGTNGRESRKSAPVNETTLTQTIGNISYSPVSGDAWTSQGDGSYKSPSGYSSSKVRVNFTSYVSNATITIQLSAYNSYTSSYSYAYVGALDNASASYSSYYDLISAYSSSSSNSKTVTITVSVAGNHFVDIGYYDIGYGSSNTMYATFKIIE